MLDNDLYIKTKIDLKEKVKNRLGEKGAIDRVAKIIRRELGYELV